MHHRSELAKHDAVTLTTAGGARLDGTLLATLSIAALADNVLLKFKLRRLALVEVGERDVDAVDKVLALARASGASSSSESSSEGLNGVASVSKTKDERVRNDSQTHVSSSSSTEQLGEEVSRVHASAHATHAALEASLTSLVVAVEGRSATRQNGAYLGGGGTRARQAGQAYIERCWGSERTS